MSHRSQTRRMRGFPFGWLRLCALLGSFALLPACAYRPEPVNLDPSPQAVVTSDGLHRAIDRRLSSVFVKPGARFDAYDAYFIEKATLRYASPPKKANVFNWSHGNFELGPEYTDRLERIFRESIAAAVDSSDSYASKSAVGPRTLRLVPHILDFVYNVPPRVAHQDYSIVLQSGVMTLALEIFDSETGERLARFAERRAIRPQSSNMLGYDAGAVNTWIGVRDVCDSWSARLALELRGFRESSPIPPPGSREEGKSVTHSTD